MKRSSHQASRVRLATAGARQAGIPAPANPRAWTCPTRRIAEPSCPVVEAALRQAAPGGKRHAEACVKNAGDTIRMNFVRVAEPGDVPGSRNDPRMYGVRVE